MSRNVMYALLVIAVSVVVLVINRSSVTVDLIVYELKTIESFAYLMFIALGVFIGILLK